MTIETVNDDEQAPRREIDVVTEERQRRRAAKRDAELEHAEKMKAEYLAGATLLEMERRHGISAATIQKRLRDVGTEMRRRGPRRKKSENADQLSSVNG